MVYKSEQSVILYGEETTQGELITPSDVFSPIQDDVTLPDPEYDYEEEYFVGAGQLPADKFAGQEALTGGSIPFRVTQWFELYLLLGEYTQDGSIYTLNLKEDDYPPSVSLGVNMDDFTRVFTGVTASSGELSIDNEDQLVLDLDFDALGVDTSATIDEPTSENFDTNETFDFNSTSSNLTIFNKDFARLQDFALTVERNTTIEYYVEDTDGPFEILYGRPTLTLSATITVSDTELYDELIDGSVKFESNIEFTNSDSRINITLQDCNIRSAPHEIPNEGPVEVDVEIAGEDLEIVFEELA